jgi:hypothetical protein
VARERYERQVQLLVQIIPAIAEEGCFALKGGTAINLFHRDMPRLSVDIDMVFLPARGRAESLVEIDAALDRIRARIEATVPSARAQRIAGGGRGETRVLTRVAPPRSRSRRHRSRAASHTRRRGGPWRPRSRTASALLRMRD